MVWYFENRKYLRQRYKEFDSALLDIELTGTVYIEGYWQSEGYFEGIREEIRSELSLKQEIDPRNQKLLDEISSCEGSVGLHVRFFSDDPNAVNNVSVEYYRSAIRLLESSHAYVKYYIFSDKPEAAVKLLDLGIRDHRLVTHNSGDLNAHLDMVLMSNCKHIIGANSTFSWWALWLSDPDHGIKILPGVSIDAGVASWGFKGLLPDRWNIL